MLAGMLLHGGYLGAVFWVDQARAAGRHRGADRRAAAARHRHARRAASRRAGLGAALARHRHRLSRRGPRRRAEARRRRTVSRPSRSRSASSARSRSRLARSGRSAPPRRVDLRTNAVVQYRRRGARHPAARAAPRERPARAGARALHRPGLVGGRALDRRDRASAGADPARRRRRRRRAALPRAAGLGADGLCPLRRDPDRRCRSLGMAGGALQASRSRAAADRMGINRPPRAFMLHRTAMGAPHDRPCRRLRCRAGPRSRSPTPPRRTPPRSSPRRRRRVRAKVVAEGRISAERLEAEQHAAHGLAWLATYAEAIRELAAYAERLSRRGPLRRDRGPARPHRHRRIPRPDLRRHPDEPGRDRAPRTRSASRAATLARFRTEAVETLIETATRPRTAPASSPSSATRQGAPTVGDAGLDETLEAIRAEMRRFGEAEVAPHAHGWHLANAYIPLEVIEQDGRARRVRADHPGGIRRHGPVEGLDVRRLGGAVARLYRRRLARHALGDRGRADPRRRHRGAEAALPARHRLRRDPADRGLHRAEHRLRPRLAADPRACEDGEAWQGLRQQDLDHPSGPRRPDDAARAHEPGRAGPQGPLDAARREAARHGRRAVPGRGPDRRRDRGARLSRHEGIRARLRRLRGAGREPPRRRRGPGLPAAHADLRIGPHPDRGAGDRRRAIGARPRRCATPRSASSSASR